jgi:hypothetical protein
MALWAVEDNPGRERDRGAEKQLRLARLHQQRHGSNHREAGDAEREGHHERQDGARMRVRQSSDADQRQRRQWYP